MRRIIRCTKIFESVRFALLLALGTSIGAPRVLLSQIAPGAQRGSLAGLAFQSERLAASPALEEMEGARSRLAPEVEAAWAAFRLEHGAWTAYLDSRSGRIESAEGEGIPWIPGLGNRLKAGAGKADLAALERIARRFVAEQGALLGLDGKDLVLSAGRSGAVSDSLWYIDFDVTRAGIPIEGARVVFRVNHGNLIQFGLENVPPSGVAVPKVAISAEQALRIVAERVGGLVPGRDEILDRGSLHLLPSAANDARFAEGFAFGKGYGLTAVWEVSFRRAGDLGTWRARVDATRGELLSLVDVNRYEQATGGVILNAPTAPDTVKAMPWADLSNGTFTNENGRFPNTGPLSSTLNGQFVRIADGCGAISADTDPTGNLPFGASASGTDCTTPGTGGAGNTRSARTTFFWLNRAKEVARGWLPAIGWLSQGLSSSVNLTPTCNAYWDGTGVQFFQARPPCGNTGELPAVAIHEFGHGLDANDGNGESDEFATGESNGDLLAALMLHRSCVGPGFFSSTCAGYGDSCTSCTGVREIDWARHASNTPHNVVNFTQHCPFSGFYVGPCLREGHCESMLPSEAVWDFVNRDLPNPGGAAAWNLMERLWFVTRPTAGQSFTCDISGVQFKSNGCNVGALWKVLRAADDDDGNLANGTPHGAALYNAFNRHGLACLTDPGIGVSFAACLPPAVPVVSATPGDEKVSLSWAGPGGGTVYDVYRNDLGCNAAFAKISSGTASAIEDSTVVNGQTYYYQVVARPPGNEACASAPSPCRAVVPHAPPTCHKTLLYSNDFEAGTGLADWVQGPVVAEFGTKNWRGIQACPAASGTGIFRFGGATCTGDYGTGEYAYAQPHGVSGIGIPVGSLSPRLTFSHRRAFEAGRDGAMLAVSVDGGPYEPVPASAITSGGYDGTIDSSCSPEGTFGLPVWTGSSAGFVQTAVDLSGFCPLRGGCGGHTLGIKFTAITDCAGTDDGWFLDDVAVTACVP